MANSCAPLYLPLRFRNHQRSYPITLDLIRPSRIRLTEDSQSLSKEEMMSVAHSYARKTRYATHKASAINPALVAAISDSRRDRRTRAPSLERGHLSRVVNLLSRDRLPTTP